MKKAILILLTIGSVFIMGCQCERPTLQKIATTYYRIPSFNSIVIGDNSRVEITNGDYGIEITGANSDQDQPVVESKNQTLYIYALSINSSNISIKISVPELNIKKLTISDYATLHATNLKGNIENLVVKDNGTVNLEGHFNIQKILQSGKGKINISWVDSNTLQVASTDSGPIFLGGRTNILVAKLTNQSILQARYLRVQKAHIFTTDLARAEILPLDTLHGHAINSSNILYHTRPTKLKVVTKDAGNVLKSI